MRGRITEASRGFVGQLMSSNGESEDLSLVIGAWMFLFIAKSCRGAEPN